MYPSPLKRLFTTACLLTPRSPLRLRVGASAAASGRRKMLRQAHAIRKLCLHLRTSLGTGNEKSAPWEGTPAQAPHEFKHPRQNLRTLATKPKKATGYIPPSAATVVICFQILTFAVAATVRTQQTAEEETIKRPYEKRKNGRSRKAPVRQAGAFSFQNSSSCWPGAQTSCGARPKKSSILPNCLSVMQSKPIFPYGGRKDFTRRRCTSAFS